jgi:hypothetical protein
MTDRVHQLVASFPFGEIVRSVRGRHLRRCQFVGVVIDRASSEPVEIQWGTSERVVWGRVKVAYQDAIEAGEFEFLVTEAREVLCQIQSI